MESLYTLSGPPSWVTASTNLSWSSAVHRRRGFGSVVRTKLASPGKFVPSSDPPWNSPCPPLPSSGSECIAEYIFPRQKMNPPTEKKGNEKMQQKIRFWFQGRGAEPQVRTEKERREREREEGLRQRWAHLRDVLCSSLWLSFSFIVIVWVYGLDVCIL